MALKKMQNKILIEKKSIREKIDKAKDQKDLK